MRTTVVLNIEHPDGLDNITPETIKATFDEAGDIAWTVEIESIQQTPQAKGTS